jgi:DNA-binding Lrp family transcriptional regulator
MVKGEKTQKSVKVKVVKLTDDETKILRNLYENREGLRVNTLIKLTNLSKRTLYRRLKKLKERELIENIYPIWKIVHGQVGFCQSLLQSKEIFELHNLSYILKLIKTPDWWNKRKPRLEKLKGWQFSNHNFGKNNSNPYQQIINENFAVQTYPESIMIISRKRYYSNNPYETIEQGMSDVLDLIEFLEERFRFKFFPEGVPSVEIRGNDFNRMKDALAEHCKKEGRRFLVELDKNRKVWVDYSEPFGKEANYPEGQEILEKVTKDYLLNKPKLNSELQKDILEANESLNEVGKLIRKSSELQMDSELRLKQMEARLRGHEELILQILERLNSK